MTFCSSNSGTFSKFCMLLLATILVLLTLYNYQLHFSKTKPRAIEEASAPSSLAPTPSIKFERIPWDSRNSVTPIIHQSWKTRQLPTARAIRWRATWKSCFPDWEMKLWTDDDNLELIREQYPWFLPLYLSFKQPVERADIARYFYLYHYGGIYTDLDNICVRNFTHMLTNGALFFGGMDSPGKGYDVLNTYVQNSFMAARPGHPFWMRLISFIMLKRFLDLKSQARPEFTTGPYALMEEMKKYKESGAKDMVIYPSKYFNPFSWWTGAKPRCKDRGNMNEEDEKACIAAYPEAYVVQMHAASWHGGHM